MRSIDSYARSNTLPGALLLAALLAVCLPVQAAEPESPGRIHVRGEGSVELAPDMALLQLTVTREADTARAALDASSAAMAEVISALREQGIAERDIQTSQFSIQPRYVYPRPQVKGETEPPRIVGYTVRNGLGVRVRDLEKLGAVIDRSVTLGVNEGGNITFTNDDPSAALEQARTRAVQQATAKAGTLAAAAGVELGRVLEIAEQSHSPRPVPVMRAQAMMADAAEAVPVAAGENSYQVAVDVTYAIEQ